MNTYYASSATNVIFKIIFFISNRKNILNFLNKMDLITQFLRKKDSILIQIRITKNVSEILIKKIILNNKGTFNK